MAVKTLAETLVPPRLNLQESYLVTWLALANGDTGAPVETPEFADRTVQFGKTGDAYGAGTLVLEGSNDGATWFTLKSPLGTALSVTVNAMHGVLESPRFMRPNLGGGAAGGVDVFLMCRRARGRAL
jgi:hypothetical protein